MLCALGVTIICDRDHTHSSYSPNSMNGVHREEDFPWIKIEIDRQQLVVPDWSSAKNFPRWVEIALQAFRFDSQEFFMIPNQNRIEWDVKQSAQHPIDILRQHRCIRATILPTCTKTNFMKSAVVAYIAKVAQNHNEHTRQIWRNPCQTSSKISQKSGTKSNRGGAKPNSCLRQVYTPDPIFCFISHI